MTNLYLASFILASTLVLRPLEACEITRPQGEPVGSAATSAKNLVKNSDLIVLAKATGYVSLDDLKIAVPDLPSFNTLYPEVQFELVGTLKGEFDKPIKIRGWLWEKSQLARNQAVPYIEVGRTGQGLCFAFDYRIGETYLFLLKNSNGTLSPYWRALAPTNEFVVGPDDPWVVWIRHELGK
ncbi:hypothetical protein AAKU67_004067 [Oxalobacteraceae bacterium GrIS 2.11]